MLIGRSIFSLLFAILLGLISASISFDFENYVYYAANPASALKRFSTEPIFPYFVIGLSLLGFSGMAIVQLFSVLAAFIVVYAIGDLACGTGRWSYTRVFTLVVLTLPFILFSLIVPRQGLATGLALLALVIARREEKAINWKTLLLLLLSGLSHTATAGFSAALIFLGRASGRYTLIALSSAFALIIVVTLVASEFLDPETSKYYHYYEDFRETGRVRFAFFILVLLAYIALGSKRNGGFLGGSPIRARFVTLLFSIFCVAGYFFVSTDTIRISYILGILMIVDVSSRFRFGDRN